MSSMRDIGTHKPDCHLPFCESKICPLATVSVAEAQIEFVIFYWKSLMQRRLIVLQHGINIRKKAI